MNNYNINRQQTIHTYVITITTYNKEMYIPSLRNLSFPLISTIGAPADKNVIFKHRKVATTMFPQYHRPWFIMLLPP